MNRACLTVNKPDRVPDHVIEVSQVHGLSGFIEAECLPIGIAVHIASRVAQLGDADDVLVSRTVKDLVAGSGIKFEDFGMHTLKGIPEAWQVFRALG